MEAERQELLRALVGQQEDSADPAATGDAENNGRSTLSDELLARFRLRREQVLHCSFPHWYPRFRHLTFRSEIIPLSEEVVSYLSGAANKGEDASDDDEEGSSELFFLPASAFPPASKEDYCVNSWSDEEEEEEEGKRADVEFPELAERVSEVIERFEGGVLPKLNWSSPKDALWMSLGNTLRCDSFGDIMRLLKSSDFITHDLCHAFALCEDHNTGPPRPEQFVLVLRKWYFVSPAMEFRCFMKGRQLIGITQRDPSKYFAFLKDCRHDLRERIAQFFQEHIQHSFEDEEVVFDVYLDKKQRVWLVDFNPFSPHTDSLLFSWQELLSFSSPPPAEAHDCELRIIESEAEVRRADSGNRLPDDLVDVSSAGGIESFIAMVKASQEAFASSAHSSA
ncbi:Cell division cycle protein 123 [Balamuthia mandrillaris]